MSMSYLHSHVYTEIRDNSVTVSVSDGGTVGFFPIFADKGKENELVLIESGVNTFVDTYGANGVKFGQSQLNVLQWLKGGGSAYVMRLLPDDASFASAALIVNVDSYMPQYSITLNVDGTPIKLIVCEGFIYDGSLVKELKVYPYGGTEADAVSLFRTGQPSSAEGFYDESEDWMVKEGYAVLDKENKVSSYVNYNLISSKEAILTWLKLGTKALSPAFVEKYLSDVVSKLAIVVENSGKEDLVLTPDTKVYIMAGVDTFRDPVSFEEVDKSLVRLAFVGDYSVKKERYNPSEDENEVYYKNVSAKPVLLMDTEVTDFANSADVVEMYEQVPEGGDDTEERTYLGRGILLKGDVSSVANIQVAGLKIFRDLATAGFGKKEGQLSTLKEIFDNPSEVNVFYSLKYTSKEVSKEVTVEGVTSTTTEDVVYVDYVSATARDIAVDAQYFLDGYPIEIFSTPSKKSPSGKIWNARITITDSDGVSSDVVIFRETIPGSTEGITEEAVNSGKPIFTQEAYVFNALNALFAYGVTRSGDTPSIYEPKVGPAFLSAKGEKNYSTETSAPFFLTENYGIYQDGVSGTVYFGVQWLNKEALASAVYSGKLEFSRKDADKVAVEVYSPSPANSTSKEAVKLDIYDYCNNYNTNISRILEGKKKYPIGYFLSACKGEYYNNIKVYLKLNDSLKDTYDFRLYDLEVYDVTDGKVKVVDGPFTVALDKNALDLSGASMYIKSILDTYGAKDANGDNLVNFFDDVDEDAFANCCDDLSSLFRLKHPSYVFDKASVDPLFIPMVDENITSAGNSDYEFHSRNATTENEDDPVLRIQGDNNISVPTSAVLSNGFMLANGSSGTLFDKRGSLIASETTKLLGQAFSGSINPHVTDVKNYEFDVLMDAKFPRSVKISMVQLASAARKDCIAVLDTDNMLSNTSGPANSAVAAIKARKAINISDYAASIWCQNTTAYDEYTGRDIPVSATYLLSYKIPFNDNANGIQTSFVGPRRGTVDLYKEVSWYPTEAEKEALYKAQINYISKDPKRIAFDNQLTSQTVTSALSNIPNVRVLFKIKRAVEKICDEYRFERNNGGTRSDMETQINEYLKSWVNNGACETCTASVSATDYQIKQKIAQVTIDVVFVGFLERIHVVINVNG